MSMKDMENALKLVDENECQADFEGGKSMSVIEEAQKALSIRFPPTYLVFLRRLGCGDIAGQEFYGVINGDFHNSCIPDAIWLTLSERENSNLDKNLILVHATGTGEYHAIDANQATKDDEYAIVRVALGSKIKPVFVFSDFGEFFFHTIRSALAN